MYFLSFSICHDLLQLHSIGISWHCIWPFASHCSNPIMYFRSLARALAALLPSLSPSQVEIFDDGHSSERYSGNSRHFFLQLTSVLHASCPARLDLQPLLHPALYEHAAEGTRQFASSLLGEIGICICEVFAQVFVIFSPQYLPRAVLPRLPHAAPRQGRSGIIGSILPFQAIETYCRTTDGVSAPYCDLISSKMLKFKL